MIKLADNLTLPADLAGRRTAVFGISGSGKSNTATVIVEELIAAGEQVVVVDHKGEGWGLLSDARGKPSNLDVIIFGEPRGHITNITEAHGPRLADFAVDSGRSIVLSLTGFESDQYERRFVSTFLRELYRRKSRQAKRTRTLVVLEEAHLFVPESAGRGFKGDAAELAGACQRIVRQGRSFGLGSLVVDQRPQDVAKRVITQCDTIICHQLTHKLDRDALDAWVRGHDTGDKGDEFLSSLASLKPGEAWVWAPQDGIFKRGRVRRRNTYDSGAAPDGRETVQVKRAEIDLAKLGKQLEDLVEKAKADDPAQLRKKIAELSSQLAKPEKPSQEAIDEAVNKRDHFWLSVVTVMRERLSVGAEYIDKTQQAIAAVMEYARKAPLELRRPIHTTANGADRPKPAQPSPAPSHKGPGSPDVGSVGLRRILVALAQKPEGLAAGEIGLRAQLSSKGGTFDTYISRARTAGWIEGDKSRFVITDAGLAALGSFTPLPRGQDLINYWLGKQGASGARRMLEALVAVFPNTLTREQLGAAAGLASEAGTFGTYLSRLRSLDLIEGKDQLRASPTLFD